MGACNSSYHCPHSDLSCKHDEPGVCTFLIVPGSAWACGDGSVLLSTCPACLMLKNARTGVYGGQGGLSEPNLVVLHEGKSGFSVRTFWVRPPSIAVCIGGVYRVLSKNLTNRGRAKGALSAESFRLSFR